MLYLSRKVGESVIINNSIELTVVEVRGKTAKIGFSFPPEVTVLRKEIYEKVTEANHAASAFGGDEDILSAMGDDPIDTHPKGT